MANPLTEPLNHPYVLSTVKEAITERVYGTEEEQAEQKLGDEMKWHRE